MSNRNTEDKKKRSSSKTKDKDNKQSSENKDNKQSKLRSGSKERNEEKSNKQDKKQIKETVNGHTNDKEHRSRDEKKLSNDKHRRDDSKTKSEKSSDKQNESKDRKDSKTSDSKTKSKIPTKEVIGADNEEKTEKKHKRSKHKEEENIAVKTTNDGEKLKKSSKSSVENGHEEKEHKAKPKTTESIRSKPEDDGYDDYEEDFEDYEEDFEEEEEFESRGRTNEKEVDAENEEKFEEVTKRVVRQTEPDKTEETKAVSSKYGSVSRASNESRPSTVQSRIDFSKAKYSEIQMASHGKLKRRERELLGLIELDSTTYDLFDLAPIKDYEFFIQNFGKSNMKQVLLQTDDDAVERELQTDEIDVECKWTQHPPTDLAGCGGFENVTNVNEENKFRIDTELFNSTRFRRFIEKGGKLIFELLDDVGSGVPSLSNRANMNISDGYNTLSLGFLSKQCRASYVLIAPDNPHLLLTAFFVDESLAEDIVDKCVVCLWNSSKLDIPQKIMLCNNEVKCACFSPGVPTAVYAGLNDGSLAAWDLLESEALHKTIPWQKEEVPLRTPTYDTAFLLKENDRENRTTPLVAVTSLESSTKQAANLNSYQIATLEETGFITIWTVLISVANELFENDLGLSPGGRLKLVKSASVKPSTGSKRSSERFACQCFCLGYSFGRPLDFYVGTDAGYVFHSVRHENKSGPSIYRPELEAIADVLSLQFSPFEFSVLLAGLSDGSIYLYKTNLTKPLGVFQITNNSDPVKSIQWSPNSPYTFYSLHGNSVIAVWDLKHNKQAPVQIEKTKPIISLSISTWIYSDDVISSTPFMILACEDGTTEVHSLKSSSSGKYNRNDGQKLLTIVERL